LIGFLVASIGCAVAPSVTFLIIARAVQGVAGALLVPSSLALIISSFKGREQGKAIGTWTAWTGISFLIGPLLGGFLVDTTSWRLVFWINVLPIAVTLFLMRFLQVQEKLSGNVKVDVYGAILCAIGLGGPVFAFIEKPAYGWASGRVLVPLIVGVLCLAAFIWHERRTKEPMLPLELFKVRNFSAGNIATTAIYGGLSIATFLIVLFLQQAGHYTALEAGVALLPITIIMFFLSSRFGALAGKFGPRLFMGVGPLVAATGFAIMLSVDRNVSYWTQLFPGIVVFGIGLSMTVAPLTSAILADIADKHAGVGSAINNAVSRVAGLVAIALIGLVIGDHAFDSGSIDHAVRSFHHGIIATAVLLAAGGIISAIGIRNPSHQKLTTSAAAPAK
jgi:EmrB/QacA subfamily drug resistance transporter